MVVSVVQTGSEVSAVIPGFGHIECTAAPAGTLPRVTGATLTVENVCGHLTETYSYLPTDDGRVLTWFLRPSAASRAVADPERWQLASKLTPK